jgi:5-methylcytosine-specific restriction enzyme A
MGISTLISKFKEVRATMSWLTSDRASRLPPNWESQIVPRILGRDNRRCQLRWPGCQVEATEVDHKIRGDNHDDKNLQAVCERCHARKSAREGNEAKRRLKELRLRPPERHPGLRKQ